MITDTAVHTQQNVDQTDGGVLTRIFVDGDTQAWATNGMQSDYHKDYLDSRILYIAKYADIALHVGDQAGAVGSSPSTLEEQHLTWGNANGNIQELYKRMNVAAGNWDYNPGGVSPPYPPDLTSFTAGLRASGVDQDETFESFYPGDASLEMQCYVRRINVRGIDWLIVNHGFAVMANELEWLDSIVAAYPDHQIILNTHCFIGNDGVNPIDPALLKDGDAHAPRGGTTPYFNRNENVRCPDEVWDGGTVARGEGHDGTWIGVKNWANLRIAVCGHTFLTGAKPQQVRNELVAADGHKVYAFHVNYQGTGGFWRNMQYQPYQTALNGIALEDEFVDYARILEVRSDAIYVHTWSTGTATPRDGYFGGAPTETVIIKEGADSWLQ